MLHYLYTCSLPTAALILLCMAVLWPFFSVRTKSYGWSIINFSLFLGSLTFILFATILTRTPGDYEAILTPFASLTAARIQPELYREMLMNVFLFFPLGLTLSNALPRKWHRWLRIILTTLIGCILSAGIEYAQYCCALGMAEVDDVICNTLGAFIGTTSLLIAHATEKYRERVWHTNMTLTTTETQFLHIAKSAISGGDLPAEKVDWPAIFTLANQQAAHISNAGPGEGLIFFGNVILPFVDDFPKDNELYSIMTTKLGETGKGENEHE